MRAFRRFVLTLLASLFACQSYVAVPVQPVTLVAVAQRRKVRVATRADILLVVDDSLSMSGKQDRLASALAGFTATLDALVPKVDYQVAVVTTSIAERFGACGPDGDPFAAAQCESDWGARGFVCQTGACVRTFPERAGKLRRAPGAPGPILRRNGTSAGQFAAWLALAVQAGVDGSRDPQGLEAMKLALSDPATGLIRDGSKVVVAFFSDAEDCSDPGRRFSMLERDAQGNIIDRCAQESAGDGSGIASLEPVSRYVNFLRDLKNSDGSGKEVEVAAVVSLAPGTSEPGLCKNAACEARCASPAGQQACAARCEGSATPSLCMADCTAECQGFCGGQVPGRRYVDMAVAFSGVAASICTDDASGPLGRLAQAIGIPKDVLLLAEPRSTDLLRVRVERAGGAVDCLEGRGYDLVRTSEGLAVRFTGECVLQPDDTWDVRYLTRR